MKKVGIVTHYYRNNNYGGNLQAYALATFINSIDGFEAEQICFDFLDFKNNKAKANKIINSKQNNSFLTLFKRIIRKMVRIIKPSTFRLFLCRYLDKRNSINFSIRQKAMLNFNENVTPHSREVYSSENINACKNDYDIFITGSDQVWSGPNDVFMLNFVENKIKISYAASISRQNVSDVHKEFIRKNIKGFLAISVRDETDKKIVDNLTDKEVKVVLDPVFLLDGSDWDRVSTIPLITKKDYVFCYFLGDCKRYKKIVKAFAKKNKLQLVIIPNFKDNENKTVFNDLFLGNYKPYNVSPSDFISLIREAKYIFTDSFHALAFSIIYNKQFFVFDRKSKWGNMSSRIVNLLSLLGLNNRFCCGKEMENVRFLNKMSAIDYSLCFSTLEERKKQSKEFLINSIYGNKDY